MVRDLAINMRRGALATAVALLCSLPCSPQEAQLALDFAPGAGPAGTRTGDWMPLRDGILFSRIHPGDRVELWFTDGSQEGTRMLFEGTEKSSDGELFGVELGDGTALMVFSGLDDAGLGRELWRTDGTLEGTSLLTDLCPGPCDGFVQLNGGGSDFQQREGKTYFLGQAEPDQQRLYAYDVVGGLGVVSELPALGFSLARAPLPGPNVGEARDGILVLSRDAASGAGSLWLLYLDLEIEMQLTTIATPTVESMLPFRDGALAVLDTGTGNRLLFLDHTGVELVSFNAASVTPLRIQSPNGNSSQERVFTFRWSTGGCQVILAGASTLEVQVVGQFSTYPCWDEAQVMGQRLVFAQSEGPSGARVLATNSTGIGTFALVQNGDSERPQGVTVLDSDQVVWLDQVGVVGRLVTSSGLGSSSVRTFQSVDGTSFGDGALPVVNGNALFIADEGSGLGAELWRTNGSYDGTAMVANLTPDRASSDPRQLRDSRFGLLFAPADPPWVIEEDALDLWVLPDSESGPALVARDRSVLHETASRLIVESSPDDRRTIVALNPVTGVEEIVFDALRDVPFLSPSVVGSAQVGERVVFRSGASSGSFYVVVDLWSTDGTIEGTINLSAGRGVAPLRMIETRTSSGPAVLSYGPGRLFSAMWVSDGTSTGTRQVHRSEEFYFVVRGVTKEHAFVTLSGASGLGKLDLRNGSLTFADPAESVRVYRDGDIGAGLRGRLIYLGPESPIEPADGSTPPARRLFSSDATISGTVALGEFESLSVPRLGPSSLAYFSAIQVGGRSELWVTDGTVAGTQSLGVPVTESQVAEAESVDGVFAFAATTPGSGSELWLTDGTIEGTRAIEIEPGPVGSAPGEIEASRDKVYFAAHRSDVGREMFSIDRLALRKECEPSETRICLGGGRFAVEAEWFDRVSGDRGPGRALPFRADTGRFWFFDENNVELVFKVLDARSFSDHFWVFYGALSDVNYWLTVTDTWSGESRTYSNEQGNICGSKDLIAFAADPEIDNLAPVEDPAVSEPVVPRVLETHPVGEPLECSERVLCLQEDRFRISVDFHVLGEAEPGVGIAVPDPSGTNDETGYFWFFTDQNIELAIKVIDGRAINDNWWLYYGGLSDVEYTITVVDSVTGLVRTYENAQGSICGDSDVGAFPDTLPGH